MPPQSIVPSDAVARFWARVDKNGPVPVDQPELGPCWLWTGCRTPEGYGKLKFDGRYYRAHRLAYELTHGPIPAGFFACHRCDTPPCVRPSHLFLGTHTENNRDAKAKGRNARGDAHGLRLHPGTAAAGERNGTHTHPERRARGERHGSRTHPERVPRGDSNGLRLHPERVARAENAGQAKLTWPQVDEIRRLYAAREATQPQLGAMFGVRREAINQIIRGRTWKEQWRP